MRRMIVMALGLGLLGAGVGCYHTGVCDCQAPNPGVLHAEPPLSNGGPVAPPGIQAEPIREAPRPLDKGPAAN